MTSVAYLETSGDRHTQVIAGLTALERKVREVAKAGATRAIVAGTPVEMPRPLPIPVEFVPPDAPPPEGAQRERADVIAGIELVDAEACRKAEWLLIRRMNKAHEGPVDALINWRFSMRITRVIARRSLKITPNHITLLGIVVGLVAVALAWGGSWLHLAIAGVCLELHSILDSCDGELARLRFQFSKVGVWLDNLADDVIDNLFIIAVGHSLGGIWWWLGLAAAAGRVLVVANAYIQAYRLTGTGDVFAFRWWFEDKATSTAELYNPTSLKNWFRSFGRRDTYVFVWLIASLANFPYWIVGHGLVMAAINCTLLFLHYVVYRPKRA